jgi:hypothetical protein
MSATATELRPTTKIDLRKSHGNWEPNETSRTPMNLQPGQNPWTIAYAMMQDMESARSFRPESHIVIVNGEKKLEWWLRTFEDYDDLGLAQVEIQELDSELADALCQLEDM